MSKKLLDSSSSSEDEEPENDLKINENFAKKFNTYREKEEFQRLKSKYGEEAAKSKLNLNENDSEDDSSSEEEDENAEVLPAEKWTEEHEKDFFKTLSNLKQKNAKIYDGETLFFKKSFENVPSTSSKTDTKPVTLLDLERKVITEREGEFEELADEKLAKKQDDKTHVQEMLDIQEGLKKAVQDSDDSDSESDGLLVHKVKTEVEKQKDDEEYGKWIIGQKEHLKNQADEGELKTLKDYWTDKNLDEGEKFLRDYILNKKYLENADNDNDNIDEEDGEDLSEDEETLEKQEEFEHKYNFRFEDPDQEFIKRYPRTIQESMRKKDDSRKRKREEVKDRKIREKEKKRDELMQLKALKRKEILEKIQKLRKITGNDELAFKDEDLEDDFDPDKHDERMAEIFQQFDEAPLGEDDEKPIFSDDLDSDLEVENWDEYGVDPDEQDDDFEHDDGQEEILENQHIPEEKTDGKEKMQKELIEASTSSKTGRKKSKKKSKFAEVIEAKKPVFDPSLEKNFDEYLDEYYKLDYEDIIGGDLPCRFKYRKVAANDLGLTTEEILSAPDRELNAWASLKKTCQYRSDKEEKADIEEYAKKKNDIELKKKMLPSLFLQNPEESLVAEKEKKAGKSKNARRRRKRNQLKEAENKQENQPNPAAQKRKIEEVNTETTNNEEPKAKKKRNKKKKKQNNEKQQQNSKKLDVNKELAMSDVRLEHYGLNKRKVRKQIYNAKNTCSTSTK